jgi:diguanylate cyclase
MSRSSLRQQLVFPFVFLILFVSIGIGWISFRAGENAVDELTHRVLLDMVGRIGNATERHLSGALTALQAVAPDPETLPRSQPFSDNLSALEDRFWVASGLFMDVNNYVYFGGPDGRFIGVNRVKKDFVELYLREPGQSERSVYAAAAPGDRSNVIRTDNYDPRVRPWYQAALKQKKPIWSPVYNDFSSREPTITLAKSVYRADDSFAGVMATDLTLKTLTDFLRTLAISRNGVAFVIDGDGYMVATSGSELPLKMGGAAPSRMRPDQMQTTLIRDAYKTLLSWKGQSVNLSKPVAQRFQSDSGMVEMAATQLGDRYGVQWTAIVAVPRTDFMGGVTRSLYQGIAIGVACVLFALLFGVLLLNRVLRDIRLLTQAARKVGNGEPIPQLNIRRRDEIGQLARTFSEMEHNLRIDKLTSVFNRESLHAQIGFLQRQTVQHSMEETKFALLFIDLDRFKSINDQHGHGAGDQVLITVAARLKAAVRANDVVARFGGDEFVVLLKGTTAIEDVEQAAEKIRAVVEEPIALEHGSVEVGVSLGWALFPQDGMDTKSLLKVADSRMFQTKKTRKAAR